jgi:hypothetical protein
MEHLVKKMGYITRGVSAAMQARNNKTALDSDYEADFGFMTVLPESELLSFAKECQVVQAEMNSLFRLPFQDPEDILEVTVKKMEQKMAIFRLTADIYKLRAPGK